MSSAEELSELLESSLRLAKSYSSQGSLVRSFGHYLIATQLRKRQKLPEDRTAEKELTEVFKRLSIRLANQRKLKELWQICEQAVEVCPQNEQILAHYGSLLVKEDCPDEALPCLERAIQLNPKNVLAKDRLNCCKLAMLDRWHYPMLNDKIRNGAYRQALLASCSGRSVVDIGAGTGLLSLYALEAKARYIYACEANGSMAQVASRILMANHASNKIKLLPKLSTHLTKSDIPEKIDILVTETFDCGLFGEHALEILDHAWEHLLHDNSIVIPRKAKAYVCLIDCPALKKKNYLTVQHFGHLNFEDIAGISDSRKSEPYSSENLKDHSFKKLSGVQELVSVDLSDSSVVHRFLTEDNILNITFKVICEGCVSAIALWFELELDQNAHLSTSPDTEESSCWDQATFQLPKILSVKPDQEIRAKFSLKGAFELLDCSIMDYQSPTCTESLSIIPEVMEELNDPIRSRAYENLKLLSPQKILDLSQSGFISLHLLKYNPESSLTIQMERQSEGAAETKVMFVSEVALKNGVDVAKIDCEPKENCNLSEYDLVILDPVDSDGQLNQSVFLELASFSGDILPSKISLFVQPVSCPQETISRAKILSDDSVHGLKISKIINYFSVNLIPNDTSSRHTILAPPVSMGDFETRNLAQKQISLNGTLDFEEIAEINALRYWYKINVQDCTSCYLSSRSLLLMQTPLSGKCFEINCIIDQAIMDLSLTVTS